MGNQTFMDRIRGIIGHVAWLVFLWSIRMTAEEFDSYVHIGCEPMKGVPPREKAEEI